MVVHKDIHISCPVTNLAAPVGSLLPRSGTLKAEASAGSEDDMGRQLPSQLNQNKSDIAGKADSSDNMFMEDVSLRDWSSMSNFPLISFLSVFLHD